MFIGTIWSLLPPILAIVLALITKEVYSSLFVGIVVGSFMYAQFHPWTAFTVIFDTIKDSMNINIFFYGYAWNGGCADVPFRRFCRLWKVGDFQD